MLKPEAPYSEAKVCQILYVLLRWGSGNVPDWMNLHPTTTKNNTSLPNTRLDIVG